MTSDSIRAQYERSVVPSYARTLVFVRGQGSYVWDPEGKRYLDFGAGIAVNALGHAHPAMIQALEKQSRTLIHVSNLYHHPLHAELARRLVALTGPGKVFFCNSGAEANEGLIKLARKFGHDDGKFEVITALKSFHGRTFGGMAATAQEKIRKGFEPMLAGFKHVPYNDLTAAAAAIGPQTAAILIEGIQGEGGVTPATPEYLLGLRRLCTERKILLLMDEVQCGMFRTGHFMSYQRILEGRKEDFLPDGISMAKSLGGGFPVAAVWMREPYGDLLGPGSHGTTFGGTPLACAVALAVLDTIEREKLAGNIRQQGDRLQSELEKHVRGGAKIITGVRGYGGMLGLMVKAGAPDLAKQIATAGLLVVPAGDDILRLLPPLNVSDAEVNEALAILKSIL